MTNCEKSESPQVVDTLGEEQTLMMPEELPILPLRNVVLYPYMVLPVAVGRERSLKLIEEASVSSRIIGVVAVKKGKDQDNEPHPDDLYRIGVLAQILRLMRTEENIHVLLQGIEKFSIIEWTAKTPYLKAKIKSIKDIVAEKTDSEEEALRLSLIEVFQRLLPSVSSVPEEVHATLWKITDPLQISYLVGSNVRIEIDVAQEILEIQDAKEKMRRLIDIVQHEIEVAELSNKIRKKAKKEMNKAQREYFLREQMEAIRHELGETSDAQIKIREFHKKIESSGMGKEARQEALRELARLEKLHESSMDYGVIMTYLDWMTSLPWNKATEDTLDLDYSRKVLDEDHYDLDHIKKRIIEYMAVRKLGKERGFKHDEEESDSLRRDREGAILCFVGPPGLGKTSLGKSIARAMGRKFYRMSLGGVRDEAEIRGHRRTYVGAMPGCLIQAMRRVGTINPVIMLDELDKVGSDWRGDPSSALLEVLDPEQNREFRDHYLDVPFDLSQVIFIGTANILDTIPSALRDRMEFLRLSGYTDEEKLNIARKYLLPRQIRENKLYPNEVELRDEAIYEIIHKYTREAGVRELERKISAICRKIAVKVATEENAKILIDAANIIDYLGKPGYSYDMAERTEIPGIAIALAVTSAGGDILFVEATKMPGKSGLTVTGQLGDVMKESVQTAVSYVRSKADHLGVERDFFDKHDIHIHIPAGAIPKDGPSAGVALVTALVSLVTGKSVRPDVGMTGEITLRGKVLAVGGIKDKVLAAHRAGLKTVILPSANEKDLDEFPQSMRDNLELILVNHLDKVVEQAFVEIPATE